MKKSLNLKKPKDIIMVTVSANQALKYIVPINWSKEVLNSTKQVEVCGANKSNKVVNVYKVEA
ncbi:hypothetical protein [Clostridium algidicarnis]|uniref:hypothetical protein n=1 Tax=Clostridium algidicarnis TaxID=37659 RepID=UPI0005649F66|nr:hypothetical protein [Clostridium algidicarnis]